MTTGLPASVRLTAFASGGGCATKIGQADLDRLLGGWPEIDDPRVIVGPGGGDDAAVVRAGSKGPCLVLTTDFFAPIVDDPDDYGAIAAANALSDVYAMGGTPLFALNLVAWPAEDVLPHAVLRRVLDSARETVNSAGAVVVGGHSVTDAEPKFGLAVVGAVEFEHLMTNAAGRPGDALLLTKPLGTGLVANALKRGQVEPDVLRAATASMRRLNAAAGAAATAAGVRCATDVTGFGLLGHLHSLTRASGCAAEVQASALPLLPGVSDLVMRDLVPGGSRRNLQFANGWTEWDPQVTPVQKIVAADAQTSGGLLLSALPATANVVRDRLDGEFRPALIGRLLEGPAGHVHVIA